MSLSARLTALGQPLVDEQLAHPFVRGIAAGDLDPATFRAWLEQDYLFLLDYVRVFSRLAWQAPDAHLGDLVDLAHETFHSEMDLHRSLAASFGAELDRAVKTTTCAAYTSFLLDSAASYGVGLAALLPCMWGYSQLGQRLATVTPAGSRYRAWVDTYADPAFAQLAGPLRADARRGRSPTARRRRGACLPRRDAPRARVLGRGVSPLTRRHQLPARSARHVASSTKRA